MADDEASINQWLADDLAAKPGDLLEMQFFVPGPMRRLIVHSATGTHPAAGS